MYSSAAAADLQLRVLRGLSAVRRLELAVEMSLTTRALLEARLRAEHPQWPETKVQRELLRLTLPHAVLPAPLR